MKRLLLALVCLGLTGPAFAQVWKPQSVASTVEIFVRDSSTGLGKTGVAATAFACDFTKPSDTLSATKTTFTGAASGSTHDILEVAHGKYNVETPAADLDTIGTNYLECQCAGAYDTKVTINVVAAASWAVNFSGNISDNATVAAAVIDQLIAGHSNSGTVGELLSRLDVAVSTAHSATSMPELTGVPSATPTPDEALMLIYMALRNQLIVTATAKKISNDAGTVVVKKALSSSAGTFTEAEAVNGP